MRVLEKVVSILNTEVREGLKERIIVKQRPQDGQRMKPCEYLKGKHFRRKKTASKKNLNQ